MHFHCYADDTQLYLSINPDESYQLGRLQASLEDIKTKTTLNVLLLNSDKTEVVIFGQQSLKNKLFSQSLNVEDSKLTSGKAKSLHLTSFLNFLLSSLEYWQNQI